MKRALWTFGFLIAGVISGRCDIDPSIFADLPKPAYPAFARVSRLEGVVTLTISFGKDGKVTNCTAVHYPGFGELEEYASDFVKRKWTCLKAAGSKVCIEIVFINPPHLGAAANF